MAKEKTPNYSASQEAIIRAAFAEKGSPLNFDDCTRIAAMPEMVDNDGNARKARSIAAKISRMEDVDYKAKEPTRKDGSEIAKKADLVKAIAERAGLAVSALEGLDKAPRPALVAVRDALAG